MNLGGVAEVAVTKEVLTAVYSKNKYNNFLKERKKLEEAETDKRKAVNEELCELKATSLQEAADKLAEK